MTLRTDSYFLDQESDLDLKSPRHSFMTKGVRFFLKNWFMITTIIGVIIGFGIGFDLQQRKLSEPARIWLALPGQIYIRILQLTILPMIVANIITVLASLNQKENGKVSGITIACLIVCNIVSSLIGLLYALTIRPGALGKKTPTDGNSEDDPVKLLYIFRDLLLQTFTNLSKPVPTEKNGTTYINEMVPGTNMIGTLFCAVIFGLASNAAKEKGDSFRAFFASLGEVVMYLMEKFLLITPICVMFMVMSSVANVKENLSSTFGTLALFVGLNFAGQITHLLLLMLSMICFCKNPFLLLRYSLPPYLIGFATTSAIISLPKCYDSCDQYGMPKAISRFVLPIAGTMKSDASAIFIVAAVFYTVQASNIVLDTGKIVIVIILATVYVSALPNIPSASMVVTITILSSVGIGPEKAMILHAVEFINDRLRSGNIVFSHLFCAAFVYHACEKDFEEPEDEGFSSESPTEVKYNHDDC
ncbi:hypothetical protein Aperf_G00000125842 [Anoplocephala perfoliata]